jgi:hypothetical protein
MLEVGSTPINIKIFLNTMGGAHIKFSLYQGVYFTWNIPRKKKSKKRFGWYYETPVTLGSVGWGSE